MPSNSKQPEVHFRDLPESEVQDFRQLPLVQLLHQSFLLDADSARRDCAVASAKGEHSRAAWGAGWAAAMDQWARYIDDKRTKEDEATTKEDEATEGNGAGFRDPAARKSKIVVSQ